MTTPAAGSVRWPGGAARYLHLPGAGAPLIFLPGLLASSFGWRRVMPELAEWGDCYAPDFPGIGGSDRVRRMGGISGLARWAGAFAAALRLGPAVVVGSSWGGAVALRWALDAQDAAVAAAAPATVRALVLCAPANPFFAPNWRQRALLRGAFFAGTALAHMPARWHARGLAAMFADPRRLTAEVAAGYRAPLRRRDLGAIVAAYVTRWRREMAALEPRLGKLRMPVLLVWGEQDRIVPPASARPLQAAIPGAELALLPAAGHAPFEECPPAFAGCVAPFLRRLSA